jgi:hypothetical protein
MSDTTTVNIRIDKDLRRQIEKAAADDDRSFTSFLVRAAKERLARVQAGPRFARPDGALVTDAICLAAELRGKALGPAPMSDDTRARLRAAADALDAIPYPHDLVLE